MDTPTFSVSSLSFKHATKIPLAYTCDGKNISPHIAWHNPPTGTRSFALICEDPDAPSTNPFVHWLIYNIPATMHELPEHQPTEEHLPYGILQGYNDAHTIGYYGPCPPGNTPHRYIFTLYAIDTPLPYQKHMNKEKLLTLLNGHIQGHVSFIGFYERFKK